MESPPRPVIPWNLTYDATKDGYACPQPSSWPTYEDCLFLNVYTTKLPRHGRNPKRPVLVYFHAGGFYSVDGTSKFAGPEYLLDQELVLVTLNYRLASLGFLSTGDSLAPGNNGLKDQVAAMRWIQVNIESFGGDPNSVTISGYSAGGMSVTLHMVSPMSKGLFHKAIAMSGSALAQWAIPDHQFHLAQRQARLVGCPDDTSLKIINCLKTKTAKELGDSLPGFSEYRSDPIIKWKPVIEKDFGQERFLVEDPVTAVQNGRFRHVPMIFSVTREEFSYLAYTIVGNDTLLEEMDREFERVAPIAFLYERDTERSKTISENLREFYLGRGSLSTASRNGIGKLYADGVIGFGSQRGAMLFSDKNNQSVYYYLLDYHGRYSHFYIPGSNDVTIGPVHHDDLIYLFYVSPLFPKFNESYPEYQTTKTLTKLFAKFAATGKPTNEMDNVHWDPFTSMNKQYLRIGDTLEMKRNLFEERYKRWKSLFPLK
ncbi:hypothetical protein PPYR_04567 [Photinus pyralis]|uniref:Carboxylic ester hydrolase n=1 Tax=Photinus pyralis TaxID=7054 RepID=A0A5N4AYE7_PHOPY|nr:esterase FE4-like [Photinus pyralis]KAB0802381.1 hypothetical protein PPYR_04567 [Photinus pyralis]